jgi:hypothetical protein
MELKDLLSPTRPYFARYEGTDSRGRQSFVEFELGQTDGWIKRYGVIGFPSTEKLIGTDEDELKDFIETAIGNGFRLVADEGTSLTGVNKQVLSFNDWLRAR